MGGFEILITWLGIITFLYLAYKIGFFVLKDIILPVAGVLFYILAGIIIIAVIIYLIVTHFFL